MLKYQRIACVLRCCHGPGCSNIAGPSLFIGIICLEVVQVNPSITTANHLCRQNLPSIAFHLKRHFSDAMLIHRLLTSLSLRNSPHLCKLNVSSGATLTSSLYLGGLTLKRSSARQYLQSRQLAGVSSNVSNPSRSVKHL